MNLLKKNRASIFILILLLMFSGCGTKNKDLDFEWMIHNYQSIGTDSFDFYDRLSAKEWYESDDENINLTLLMMLQVIEEEIVQDKNLYYWNSVIAINEKEKRVDLYMKYSQKKVVGFRYYPNKNYAELGIITDFIEGDPMNYAILLMENGMIDDFKRIPSFDFTEKMDQLMKLFEEYINDHS